MDHLSDKSVQYREVFACFGLAMYHTQCLEKEIGILLATQFNPRFLASNEEKRDRAFDAAFAKTLGMLITELKKTMNVPSDLEARLVQAVKARNWLSHHYFWERSGHILTEEGREYMIEELTKTAEEMNQLDNLLTTLGMEWFKQHGITNELLQEHLAQLVEETKRRLTQ